MARQPGVWLRKSDGKWYSKISGRQVLLGRTREEAQLALHRRLAGVPDDGSATVKEVFDHRLRWLGANRERRTFDDAHRILGMAIHAVGGPMLATVARPLDFQRWVDRKDWGPTYRHKLLQTVQQAFAQAMADGIIPTNPIATMRKPPRQSSMEILSRDQLQRLIGAVAGDPLADVVAFLAETGCRTQEIRAIEARHYHPLDRTVRFPTSEAKGKRMPRVIVLTERTAAIVHRLAAANPAGPIFRNGDGKPWTSNAFALRFQRLSKKLGFHVTAKMLRHTYATDALARGVDSLVVAKLMGHTSPAMLAKVYGHLGERIDYLREQALKASSAD